MIIRTTLVSACETGLGKISNGEGVYGLRRAFTVAGARQVVSSLWKVDDTGTQNLMTFFYQNLANGTEPGASFRNAQKMLRKTMPSPY